MNIYSIKEILKATNNFLDSDVKIKVKKNIQVSNEKIPTNTQAIISEAENGLTLKKKNNKNIEIPLVLENEIPANNIINQFNYKIKIKHEVKDLMINELYNYLKKKVKKNTLKLIIEVQLEKKNLENKINFLKQKENQLTINHLALKNIYELVLENNKILKIDNNNLRNNLDQASIVKEQLDIENEKLQVNLKEQKINLDESLEKNRSFEINNSELKNTISRYILNYKRLQEKINSLENSENLQFEDEKQKASIVKEQQNIENEKLKVNLKEQKINLDESLEKNRSLEINNDNLQNNLDKVKFYQDENVRLSSELLLVRKKNETIKVNLNDIELEKQKISNKIKELNNSIIGKSNIISPNIIKEIPTEAQNDINKLNDIEHKSLDEVINRIFSKI
jgi:hypothetical protein